MYWPVTIGRTWRRERLPGRQESISLPSLRSEATWDNGFWHSGSRCLLTRKRTEVQLLPHPPQPALTRHSAGMLGPIAVESSGPGTGPAVGRACNGSTLGVHYTSGAAKPPNSARTSIGDSEPADLVGTPGPSIDMDPQVTEPVFDYRDRCVTARDVEVWSQAVHGGGSSGRCAMPWL